MKKSILYFGFACLILFECARVYLIMPMPGSQRNNSIELAYFLGSNKNIIRIIAYLLILYPFYIFIRNGKKKDRIISISLLALYLIIFYVFTFIMEADKMFYQPTKTYFFDASRNQIPFNKLVIGISVGEVSKAYPIQLIGYHHQVRDSINGVPIMVTYCTVCRTGRVFSPIVNGKIETFRLVGMDHFNAMFEDASTKSWWRQSTGECIVGPLKGYQLTEISSQQVRLSVWFRKHQNSFVLQPDDKFKESFEKMDVYDRGKSKGELTKRDSLSWKEKSWVLGIQNNLNAKTYDWNLLVKDRIIQDSMPNLPLLILLENDTASFHAYNRSINNVSCVFEKKADSIIDLNTRSLWNYDGICLEGKLKGTSLQRIDCYQEFLHSWEFFHPKSERYLKR
jgi:hypothetical protein